MKVLITGGSGFVGKNVKESLEKAGGYTICAPSSTELDCLDVTAVTRCLESGNYDYVLHFAAYGDAVKKDRDHTKILEYNLRMYHNFAINADKFGRMIYTGSGAEYGKNRPITNVREEEKGAYVPVDPYGLFKYTVDELTAHSHNIYNLRLFGIFGKHEDWKTKFISNCCCKSIFGLPLSIRQNCRFDYIWIDDFCRMLEQFMKLKHPRYHTYNAVNGKSIELKELAELVGRISGHGSQIFICREGYANDYTADNGRMMRELQGFQYTKTETAVQELYHYYEEHRDIFDLYSLIYS